MPGVLTTAPTELVATGVENSYEIWSIDGYIAMQENVNTEQTVQHIH